MAVVHVAMEDLVCSLGARVLATRPVVAEESHFSGASGSRLKAKRAPMQQEHLGTFAGRLLAGRLLAGGLADGDAQRLEQELHDTIMPHLEGRLVEDELLRVVVVWICVCHHRVGVMTVLAVCARFSSARVLDRAAFARAALARVGALRCVHLVNL